MLQVCSVVAALLLSLLAHRLLSCGLVPCSSWSRAGQRVVHAARARLLTAPRVPLVAVLQVDWNDKEGWGVPHIDRYGPLALDPAASSLHYALQCFEGLKAYVDDKGVPRLFRPDMNMKRLNRSMARLKLPVRGAPALSGQRVRLRPVTPTCVARCR